MPLPSNHIGQHQILRMSGFTAARAIPKAVPLELRVIGGEHAAGNPFCVRIWTGAFTGPELDGALAGRTASNSACPIILISSPAKINRGEMDHFDIHRSRSRRMARQGFLAAPGHGRDRVTRHQAGWQPHPFLHQATMIWLDRASKVILEKSAAERRARCCSAIAHGKMAPPPHRVPIPLVADRPANSSALRSHTVAIVGDGRADRNLPFAAPDEAAFATAGHLLEF